MTGADAGGGGFQWQFLIYAARTMLHWSMEDFWASSPVFFFAQLRQHLKYQRRQKGKGRKPAPSAPIEIRYYDQLPQGVW